MDDGKEKSFQECMEVDRTLDLNAAIIKKRHKNNHKPLHNGNTQLKGLIG